MTEEKVRKNSKSPKAGRAAKVIFGHENAILGIVLAALVGGMGTLSNGLTLSRTNMVNVLYQSSMRGVGSIGQAFVILSANIDISIGGIGLVSSIIGSSVMAEGWHNIIGNP